MRQHQVLLLFGHVLLVKRLHCHRLLLESFPDLPHTFAVLEAIIHESVIEKLGRDGLVDWFLEILEDDAFEEVGVVEVHLGLLLDEAEGLLEEVVALLYVVGDEWQRGLSGSCVTTE